MDDGICGILLEEEDFYVAFKDWIWRGWIVGLDRPVYYSEKTAEGSLDVKELWQIRESAQNLRKI